MFYRNEEAIRIIGASVVVKLLLRNYFPEVQAVHFITKFATCNLSAILQDPLNSAAGEFGGGADVELTFDVFAMGIDRVCAEKKPCGNLAGFGSFANHPKDLQFPVSQLFYRCPGRI